MRLPLLLALGASLTLGHAEIPTRYDLTASLASVPVSGGASFGPKFFFTKSNETAYRLIPQGQTESSPAASWKYWSSSTGEREILPPAGYSSLDVFGLVNGRAIGRGVAETPVHKEAALYWTPTGGPLTPGGFDLGYSGLNVINLNGLAAGYSNPGTLRIVQWNAATPGVNATEIPLPAGCSNPQVAGVSGSGEVLLYVTEAGGTPRIAIWNGTASTLIGPAPTETFYPANCAINSAGDVVMLVFTTGGAAKLHYLPAADRSAWSTFTFAGPVDSSGVYNLRLSDAGVASFDTSVAGTNTVAIVSARRQEQLTFTGYRSFLNNAGALLFGDQGNLNYWDAAAWNGSPVAVPVAANNSSGGLDVVGFNDDGHVLVLSTERSTRSLSILTPFLPQPASVRLTPARKLLRLRVGQHIRQALVKIHVTGDTLDGRIRFLVKGKFPTGLAFRNSEAMIIGTPVAPRNFTLRIGALYASGGVKKQSPLVKVRVSIQPR